MQIVFAQNQPQSLKAEKITATGIAQNVSPAAGILDPLVAATGNGRTASRVHHNSIAMAKRCGQAGIAIASNHNFCLWPNFNAKARERLSIFFGAAAGKENSSTRDFFRQLIKHRAQLIWRSETKIGRRQFPLVQNAELILRALDQDPRRLGPAAFNAQDFFAAVHCRSLPCLYHGSWPKTRRKRRSESDSSETRLSSTTVATTKKPRQRLAIANTIGFIKNWSIWKRNFQNWSRRIPRLSAWVASRFRRSPKFSTGFRC